MVLYGKFAIHNFKAVINFYNLAFIVRQTWGNHRLIEIGKQHFTQGRNLLGSAVIPFHELFNGKIDVLTLFTDIAKLCCNITLIFKQ